MRTTTRTIVGVGLASLVFAGCTGEPAEGPSPSQTPMPTASGSGYEYQQAGSLDSVGVLPFDYSGNEVLGIGLSDTFDTDRYGTYQSLVLDDSSMLLDMEWLDVSPAASAALTSEEIESGAALAVRYIVEEWVDSPLTWDDDPDLTLDWYDSAWDRGLLADDASDYHLDSLMDPRYRDWGTLIVDADTGSWRETGSLVQYRPAPYEEGVPRAAPFWLGASGVDYEGEGTTEDGVLLPASMVVGVVGGFDRPVMLLDGRGPYIEHTEGHWRVTLWRQYDGRSEGWSVADIEGVYSRSVSFWVDGGLAALPPLDSIPDSPPSDWVGYETYGLGFSLPGSYREEDPADPIGDFGGVIMMGDDTVFYESDDRPEDWDVARWAKMATLSGWGVSNPDWLVRPYGDAYTLSVEGAAWAGVDVFPVEMTDGSTREWVIVTVQVGEGEAYWFDAVLPQDEGLEFARNMAASLEVL